MSRALDKALERIPHMNAAGLLTLKANARRLLDSDEQDILCAAADAETAARKPPPAPSRRKAKVPV